MKNEANTIIAGSEGQLDESVKQLIEKKFKSLRHIDTLENAEKYIQLFYHFTNDEQSNRALGCIFGSLIGDALGAYCEFQEKIHPQVLDEAMRMPGGGTFDLRIGQYTDDNELAYHLLSGLSTFDPKHPFEEQKLSILNNICSEFIRWWKSQPFDVGITCSNGLRVLNKNHKQKNTNKEDWEKIYTQITKLNHDKQSNGSLMRIAPMAFFLTSLNIDPLREHEFIEAEIKMTHPNLTLKQAGTSWVRTLCSTILRKDNSPETFSEIYKSIVKDGKTYNRLEVEDWFGQSGGHRKESMPATYMMGWAKIAWTFGMRVLKENGDKRKLGTVYDAEFYKKEIKWVISRAGDTDTNAAIVGGLVGAIIGFKKLPIDYLLKIFQLQFKQNSLKKTDRPKEYEPINILKISLDLLDKCQQYKNKS